MAARTEIDKIAAMLDVSGRMFALAEEIEQIRFADGRWAENVFAGVLDGFRQAADSIRYEAGVMERAEFARVQRKP